jgi:sulfide dehydrogenase [flavocytochrome c] flavoprotein subunit
MTGWCPIDPLIFSSTLQSDIHVIGDATIASPMPKSAFSANLQAKLCALQIAAILSGQTPEPTTLTNTCYSYLSGEPPCRSRVSTQMRMVRCNRLPDRVA